MKSWGLLIAGAALLSGCYRSPVSQAPGLAGAPPLGGVPLSQVDLGASLLAAVDNARLALVLRDPIAASNDVGQALSFARQLPNRPSNLIRSEPTSIDHDRTSGAKGTDIYHDPLTAFRALAELTSAQAELDNSNLEAADADLHDIQDGIRQGLIPNDLPLLRAAASLDLARSAASEGRTSDFKTQLLSAQFALRTYAGPGHVAEAKALAATIGQSLAQARTLDMILPDQLSLWLGKVVEWDGTDRWSPSIRESALDSKIYVH